MNLHSFTSDNVTVVEVVGRIDSYTAPELKAQLTNASTTFPAQLVVDLKDVSFMDSSGLAALVVGMKQCRANGGDLYIAGPKQPVRMVLELTRLDKAIEIFPSDAEAIASFAN